MRYELRLNAFDMLDQVHISWHLEVTDGSGPLQPRSVLSGVLDLRGEGEGDPSAWIQDALIGVLETL